MTTTLKCPCGRRFVRQPRSKRLYCSDQCKEKQHQQRRKAARDALKAATRQRGECVVCHTPMVLPPNGRKFYCSPRCQRHADMVARRQLQKPFPPQIVLRNGVTAQIMVEEVRGELVPRPLWVLP